MAKRRNEDEPVQSRRPPATTLEDRENQLIALAVDLAEKQLRDGTCSSQVQSHYIKMGSTREQKEQQRLEQENAYLKAKIDQLASAQKIEELMAEALKAFSSYSGTPEPELEERYDD